MIEARKEPLRDLDDLWLTPVLECLRPRRILSLGLEVPGVRLHGASVGTIDVMPLVSGQSLPEASYDLVLAKGVLESVEETEIPTLLRAIRKRCDKCLFVVSLYHSCELLPDGRNLHRTVRRQNWWKNAIAEAFGTAEPLSLSTTQDAAVFATWPFDGDTLSTFTRLQRRARRRQRHHTTLERALTALNHKMWRRPVASAILPQMAGKKIAIVGNAHALGRTTYGNDIDACDIVIRFNRAVIVNAASHGTRTDWLAAAMKIDHDLWHSKGASRLLWLSPHRKRLPGWAYARQVEANVMSIAEHAEVCERTGLALPSTGFLMIDLVRRSQCLSAELFGFDGYVSQSTSGDQTLEIAPHDFDCESALISQICRTDGRFTHHR